MPRNLKSMPAKQTSSPHSANTLNFRFLRQTFQKKQKLLFSCKRKQTNESIVSLLQLTRSNSSVGGGGKLALTSTFLPETCFSFVKRFFVKILTGLANNHVVCSLCSPFVPKKETLAQDIKLCARLSKHFVSGCRDEE